MADEGSYALYRLHLEEEVSRATIGHHMVLESELYVTHGRRIWKVSSKGRDFLGEFPFVYPRDLFGWNRIGQRVSRADKCNLYLNSNGRLLGIRAGTVYSIRDCRLTPLFEIKGDAVLHGGLCEDRFGWTYFGEYFMNPERGAVKIWKISPELDRWEVAIEFAPKVTRHVHGVFQDPHDPDALWATLGDYGPECFFARTSDCFRSIEQYGSGGQNWRCVRPFFTPTHVCWLTDSQLEQNFACRMNRETHELELGQKFPCSGWYGFQASNGHCVAATTVEPGPSITSLDSSIYASTDGFEWTEVGRFRKDILRPMKVFKYGVISFPSGPMSLDRFAISGEGLSGLDGRTRYARITSGDLSS